MEAETYLCEIHNIDIELKRINDHAKGLRDQKSRLMGKLYNYMDTNDLEKVGSGKDTITIKKCTPKSKKTSNLKPKSQRKLDALELFMDAGIPNPEEFYEEFEKIQRINADEDLRISKKSKSKKDNYDSLLGF